MGGGVNSKNAHKSSFMHRFPNISGLELKNYASSLLSIWHIRLNNLDHLNRKLNFYASRKVEKKKAIEIIKYILNNFIN